MPRDIRELTDDPDAYAAELRERWGGLLSYRYLGRHYDVMDTGETDNTVTLRRDMRDADGGVLLAVLGICSPEGGGMSDLEAVPNPVVWSVQVLCPGRDVRRIEVVSETLKRGRQFGYSRSRIVDADNPDRLLALTQGQGVSLGTPPAGLAKMAPRPLHVVDSPDLPPLWRVFGAARRPDGCWALPELTVELASPDAALHIGPQFVAAETVAREAAGAAAGSDRLTGLSAQVMFLARGKVGPFRLEADSAAATGSMATARVLIYDEGNGDRPVTVAAYQFAVAGDR
ncbi:MAG: hypothetical protein U0R77_13980 [Mycolicibacterium insubricum]|nr:hypothetical protein [Mycobacterium sp.]